jgi:hypothetical protein
MSAAQGVGLELDEQQGAAADVHVIGDAEEDEPGPLANLSAKPSKRPAGEGGVKRPRKSKGGKRGRKAAEAEDEDEPITGEGKDGDDEDDYEDEIDEEPECILWQDYKGKVSTRVLCHSLHGIAAAI